MQTHQLGDLEPGPNYAKLNKIQHLTYSNKPTYTQASANSSEHTHPSPWLAIAPSTEKSFKTLEPRDRTTLSMRTHHQPSEPGGTPWRWRGAYTSTDVKENTTHPSYVPNANRSSLTNTHILGGCRFTAKLRTKRHNSTFRLLLQHLQNRMGENGPYYVRTWATNPSRILATSQLI